MVFGVGQRYSRVPMLRGPNAGGDAAPVPGSDTLLGSCCSLSKGCLRLFGCWGAGEEHFSWGWERAGLGTSVAEEGTF